MQRSQHSHSRVVAQMRKRRLQILLVDDSEADVYLFQEAIRALRVLHELQVARDGEEALSLLKNVELGEPLPVLVVLDINMPRLDGFEVLRAIRANSVLRILPVIMFTSSSDERHVLRAYELGANAYVSKPLDHFVDVVGDFVRFWLLRAQLPVVRAASRPE
jgi:CheY-like chemotaxis protein